jgi:hypothetical protein
VADNKLLPLPHVSVTFNNNLFNKLTLQQKRYVLNVLQPNDIYATVSKSGRLCTIRV